VSVHQDDLAELEEALGPPAELTDADRTDLIALRGALLGEARRESASLAYRQLAWDLFQRVPLPLFGATG
jgi:hypothetical protein